jgi:methyl-accepting chemotaxis protein
MNSTGAGIVTVMVICAVVFLLVLVTISGGIIYFMLKPLKVVEQTINGIADGNADLTRRIELDSNNEIGYLVKGFNRFTEKLQSIMQQLKGSKSSLQTAGEDLHSSTDETLSSISQIISNIEGMHRRIEDQAAGVEEIIPHAHHHIHMTCLH